jgi:glucose/mannose-6-phosphate isomerase
VVETVLDSLGMFPATAGLPEQVAHAAAVAAEVGPLPSRDDIDNVLVLGMGGSGVAGDLLPVVAGPFMPVPVVVVKGYEPPSYVNERTLVFAVSFSGDTEETIDAASTAAALGGRIIAVTQGGQLRDLASSWTAPIVPIPATIPMPRAGLGAVAIPAMVILERIGLFPGAGHWIEAAVQQLTARRDQLFSDAAAGVPAAGNPAELLARKIGRTLPIVYGGGGIGAVAASRWKTQYNENAKVPAFSNAVPELCHNELAGWGQHGDLTRQVFSLVFLRHDHEHPQIMRRFDLLREQLLEVVQDVHEVRAEGEGALAQLLDLALLGDLVSLHAAAQEDLDPGPVPALDLMKAALAG